MTRISALLLTLCFLLLIVPLNLQAGDVQGTIGDNTQIGQVSEKDADWIIELTEDAVNLLLKRLCTLYSQVNDEATERFREISVKMSGEYCTIEGVALNIKLGPIPMKSLRFKIETEMILKDSDQIDLIIKKFKLERADGKGSLSLKLFSNLALRLVGLAKRNTKLNGYVELSTSGFCPIPIIGLLPIFKRTVHVKLMPKLMPALSFLDSIQLSRRSDRFIFRGKMSVRQTLERRTKDGKINLRPLKVIPEGDVLDLF